MNEIAVVTMIGLTRHKQLLNWSRKSQLCLPIPATSNHKHQLELFGRYIIYHVYMLNFLWIIENITNIVPINVWPRLYPSLLSLSRDAIPHTTSHRPDSTDWTETGTVALGFIPFTDGYI